MKPDDASPLPPTRRLPKGPLIIILLVLATLAWVYWLTRMPPRPPPELPPVRQLPMDFSHPQDPRPDPAEGQAREQQ
ncbi:MAG TPA: hypothetical protein VN283_01800 [Thiobacillus sp.]|nr:hypothetical protein [Thiobacillus sp.]